MAINRLWLLSHFFLGTLASHFFISWYGSSIKDALQLNDATYGGIYAIATMTSSVLVITFGGVVDRIRVDKLLVFFFDTTYGSVPVDVFSRQCHWAIDCYLLTAVFVGKGFYLILRKQP